MVCYIGFMDFHKRKWKIGIAIPVPQSVHPDFAIGSLNKILSHTKAKLPKSNLIVRYQAGVRTDSNRNSIVKEMLEDKVDFILHLDADMVFPPDIIERYLEANELEKVDVIGAYYFKRFYPYNPIAYTLSTDEDKNIKPYRQIPPSLVEKGRVYEVDGLGFGGMFVARHVYERLGDKKWAVYGANFHIPEPLEDKISHDLNFCKVVKEAGMSIRLHGSVRPGHIGEILITEKDFIDNMEITITRNPDVLVIMPHINEEQAQKTAKILKARSGVEAKLLLVEDKNRNGFVKVVNDVVKNIKAELYVYTAQDVFVSKNWLYEALIAQARYGAWVTAFNDGKWGGAMAQFGMVTREWVDTMGWLFPPCYKASYCDVEISQIAKQMNKYGFAEKAIMMEIDYDKDFIGKVNKEDKALYNERKKTGFDGKVADTNLLEQFS